MLRHALSLVLAVGSVYGCDCREPSVEAKRDDSDIVFRGTIIAFRESPVRTDKGPTVRYTGRIAVFRVVRIWKGEVSQTLEMPEAMETTACTGFWTSLKMGEDLLIYASRIGSEYYTAICGYYKGAKSAKDLKKLGPGKDPSL
jgi:hypothetical protein